MENLGPRDHHRMWRTYPPPLAWPARSGDTNSHSPRWAMSLRFCWGFFWRGREAWFHCVIMFHDVLILLSSQNIVSSDVKFPTEYLYLFMFTSFTFTVNSETSTRNWNTVGLRTQDVLCAGHTIERCWYWNVSDALSMMMRDRWSLISWIALIEYGLRVIRFRFFVLLIWESTSL